MELLRDACQALLGRLIPRPPTLLCPSAPGGWAVSLCRWCVCCGRAALAMTLGLFQYRKALSVLAETQVRKEERQWGGVRSTGTLQPAELGLDRLLPLAAVYPWVSPLMSVFSSQK